MVRAIFRDGEIKPLSPIPPSWANGQELVIETIPSPRELPESTNDAMEDISPDDQARLWQAIEEHRQDQKSLTRREMGLA